QVLRLRRQDRVPGRIQSQRPWQRPRWRSRQAPVPEPGRSRHDRRFRHSVLSGRSFPLETPTACSNKRRRPLSMKKLSNEELLVELEVPFPVDQVLWRVTNTANNRTRDKRNSEIVTGKILVVCKVTIEGLGTHSGTGEEWADEENAMTSAEAQAFKRACSCFGLGRCFYDFDAPWVDLDDKGRPKKAPALPTWLIPENWRKGARPSGKASGANGSATPSHAVDASNGRSNGSGSNRNGADLDKRISALEESVGGKLYRWVLREYGHVNKPHLVRD